MESLFRGAKNAFRNPVRTISIVIILGISIGFALSMLAANKAVDKKIESVKSNIGNIINISPAGARGFEGGGEPLTEDLLTKLEPISSIVKITKSLNARLDSSSTDLESAIEAGTLGGRNQSSPSSTSSDSELQQSRPNSGNFTPPVMILGTNDATTLASMGGGSIEIISGEALDIDSENTAIVGQNIADKNNLSVGSTFIAYNTNISVVGIFKASSEDRFSGNAVIMPLKTVQSITGQTGEISSVVVQIDSINNMSSTVDKIKSALGDSADVVSQEDTSSQALSPLESVKNVSIFSLIASLVTGSIVILLTMLMIVRERRREIGVLKAIGANNLKIASQFAAESITLAFLGSIIGLLVGLLGSSPITTVLVNNASSSSATSTMSGNGPGRGMGRMMQSVAQNIDIKNIQANIGWEAIGFGLLIVLLIALVGSVIPSWFISKVKPAEVMRSE